MRRSISISAILCAFVFLAGAPQGLGQEEQIKAYCLDFNWGPGEPHGFALPGQWADASPEAHVDWYKELNANTIQTFCVSCNGYAWYKNGVVEEQPGLKHDFLREVVRLGHEEGMRVMGYFCIGANTKWGKENPDLSYGYESTPHIPYTPEYLDYLDRVIRDAVSTTGIDGFMIDWIWQPNRRSTNGKWIESEKKLYESLMNEPFPGEEELSEAGEIEYGRMALDKCWGVIHRAAKESNPDCMIWLSCNQPTHPHVINSRMFREVDWLMNEGGDMERIDAIQGMIGEDTRLMTCLASWNKKDALKIVPAAQDRGIGLYGFAMPGENSILPSPLDYLDRPVESFQGDDRNRATLVRVFAGLPITYVAEIEAGENIFFVAKDGSDGWSGKLPRAASDGKDGPFLTLEKAMSVLQPGDKCVIREGTYRETLKPQTSGKDGEKIEIMAYPGEKVVLSACDMPEGSWKEVEENIFRISYKSGFGKMVFSEGELLSRARWPNASGDLYEPSWATVDAGNHIHLVDEELPEGLNLVGCEMEALFGKEWALQYYTITAYDDESKILVYPEAYQRSHYYATTEKWDGNYAAREGNRYYLLGNYDLLDVDGEWHFDPEEQNLYVYSGKDIHPSKQSIEVKAREHCIELGSISHVEIRDLEFFGGGILLDSLSSNCKLDRLKGMHVDPGVFVKGQSNEMLSSEIAFCETGLLKLDGDDHQIINNFIHDGNYSGSWDQLVTADGRGHLISHNSISRAGGGGIMPSGKQVQYLYNDITFAGLVRHDIGGLHVGNNSGDHSVIAYNTVHEINGEGIYLDNSTSDYVIHHNLVYHCGWQYAKPEAPPGHVMNSFSTIHLNTPGNFTLVYHNTTDGRWGFNCWGRNFEDDMYGIQLINNIFTGSFHIKDGAVTSHNIYQGTDPGFMDREGSDLRLAEGSPAIGNAFPLPVYSDNFRGSGPDIGAIEYGTSMWRTGHDFTNFPVAQRVKHVPEYRNMVSNGTFESGFRDWEVTGDVILTNESSWGREDVESRMQNRAIAMEDSGPAIGQKIIDLDPDTKYVVSGWIRTPGDGAEGILSLDGPEGEILKLRSDEEGWNFLKEEFTTSPDQTRVRLSFQRSGSGGRVYLDDAGLVRKFPLENDWSKPRVKEAIDDGAWCWFSDPRAIYVHGESPGVLTGWVKQDGSIEAGLIRTDGSVDTQILAPELERDDHANPSFAELADGSYLVSYTKHFDDVVRVHSGPDESASLFGEARHVDPFSKKELRKFPLKRTTYANPLFLEEEGKLYCFGRWTGFKPNMMVSEDGGETFGKARVVVTNYPFDQGNRPYVKYYSDGKDRTHMVFTDGHPRNEPLNSVYYACYHDGAFWKADGSQICSIKDLPFEPQDATLVYQATEEKGKSWVFDVAADKEDHPVILYARYPDDENHIYHHVRFDGKEWIDRKVCNSGSWFPQTPEGEVEPEPNYSGGLCLHPRHTNVLYASEQVDGVFEIVKYRLHKDSFWQRIPITKESEQDNVRPFVPRNMKAGDPTMVLWMQNEKYIHYTDYQSRIVYTLDE